MGRRSLDTEIALIIFVSVGLFFLVYFLPAIVVLARRPNRWQLIGLLDLVAAWTVIGWIAAMWLAAPGRRKVGRDGATDAFPGWKVVVGRARLAADAPAAAGHADARRPRLRVGRASRRNMREVAAAALDQFGHLSRPRVPACRRFLPTARPRAGCPARDARS